MKISYDMRHVEELNLEKFLDFLHIYDEGITREELDERLAKLPYEQVHISILVGMGVQLIKDDKIAKKFYEENKAIPANFERLIKAIC